MTPDMPAMDEKGLTQQFIERLAKEAGGEEHGPRTGTMTFNRDALHRFADSIAKFCESAYLAATARDGEATVDEIWDTATNAVCQTMQDSDMCKCTDGQCVAAVVRPEPQDLARLVSLKASQEAEVDGPEENEIDRLRYAAFNTNSNEDKAAYYLATSKWFQDRHYRRLATPQPSPDTDGDAA
jgi:hypothetical protein